MDHSLPFNVEFCLSQSWNEYMCEGTSSYREGRGDDFIQFQILFGPWDFKERLMQIEPLNRFTFLTYESHLTQPFSSHRNGNPFFVVEWVFTT